MVTDTRVYRGVELVTDHRLLISELRLVLRKPKRPAQPPRYKQLPSCKTQQRALPFRTAWQQLCSNTPHPHSQRKQSVTCFKQHSQPQRSSTSSRKSGLAAPGSPPPPSSSLTQRQQHGS